MFRCLYSGLVLLVSAVVVLASLQEEELERLSSVLKRLDQKINEKLQKRVIKKRPELSPDQQEHNAFEGDMLLFEDQKLDIDLQQNPSTRMKRKASVKLEHFWPQAVVPFSYDLSIGAQGREKIREAMEKWEENTCVVFKNRHPRDTPNLGHSSYLYFQSRPSSCSANIGRDPSGGPSMVNADDSCQNAVMSMVHELGHVLGLWHEQSRPDRDKYVRIEKSEINPAKIGNFKKYSHDYISTDSPYDLQSLMHYGGTVFSRDASNPTTTIETVDKRLQGSIGQRQHLSYYDIKTINNIYQCNDKCTSSIKCMNHGYIGPKCSCVCPPPLEGAKCDQLPPSTGNCGGVLTDSSGVISTPGYPNSYPSQVECHWLIQGPGENSVITLEFEDFDVEPDSNICYWDRVEIKADGLDKASKRYCGDKPEDKPEPIRLRGPALYIGLFTDDGVNHKGFKAKYTIQNADQGSWGEWSGWSPCAVTCGAGIIVRMRQCLSPPCTGSDMSHKLCSRLKCP